MTEAMHTLWQMVAAQYRVLAAICAAGAATAVFIKNVLEIQKLRLEVREKKRALEAVDTTEKRVIATATLEEIRKYGKLASVDYLGTMLSEEYLLHYLDSKMFSALTASLHRRSVLIVTGLVLAIVLALLELLVFFFGWIGWLIFSGLVMGGVVGVRGVYEKTIEVLDAFNRSLAILRAPEERKES